MIISDKMARGALTLLTAWAGYGSGEELGDLTEDAVKEYYREAAKTAHPDKGGSAEQFAEVDRAKHVLLEWLKRQTPTVTPDHGPRRKCHMCGGKGFVMSQRGWRQLRTSCGACRGTGDLDTEHDYGDGR